MPFATTVTAAAGGWRQQAHNYPQTDIGLRVEMLPWLVARGVDGPTFVSATARRQLTQ